MVMIITPNDSLKDIEKKIEKLNATKSKRMAVKSIDWSKYFGKVNFGKDPLELQREWRDE
jgi:hypothetical protein